MAERDALPSTAGGVFLQHFEFDLAFLQHPSFAYYHPHWRLLVIPIVYPMVFDRTLVRSSAVFGGRGSGQMPFDETRSGHEGHVVQVEDAEV